MGLVLTAFQEDEMGSRDLGLAVEELVDGKEQLWELASMMAEAKVGGAAAIFQFRKGGPATLHNTPNCWTLPPTPSHRNQLEYEEITADSMINAIREISTTKDEIHLAYRLTNRPTFNPSLALIMIQFNGANKKFWVDCQDNPECSKALMEAIVAKAKRVHEASIFGIAMYNTFKILAPQLESISPPKGKGNKDPRRMATVHHREKCVATRKRLMKDRTDIDDCYLYHLAWELDLIARHEEFMNQGGRASKKAKLS